MTKTDIKKPIRLSPLYFRQNQSGARFADVGGWKWAAGLCEAERGDGNIVTDISPLAKVALADPSGGGILAGRLGAPLLDVGKASSKDGVICLRPGPEEWIVIASAGEDEALLKTLDSPAAVNVSGALGGLGLTGPNVERILRHLTLFDIHESVFPNGSATYTSVANIRTLIVRGDRLLTGDAYQLYVPQDWTETLYDTLLDAGEPYGLRAVGFEAIDCFGR